MAAILIVDDDEAMRGALAEAIGDLGHATLLAPSGEAALSLLEHEAPAAVFLDLRMSGIDGLEVLWRLRAGPHRPPVTILTAHATSSNTIEAMRLGAFDHLTKPVGREDVARVLKRMLAGVAPSNMTAPEAGGDGLIGTSEAMRAVQKTIGILADSDATVLIMGETGTGKELVARAIHEHGQRAGKSFIAMNCAAIPAELLETELFGHVRGAFTGAVSDRVGAFRQANGGTLFLDEIGDMDATMQAKILRALQEHVVTPVGGKPIAVDVRVVAATHRDPFQRVREGLFREDLLYRLLVVPIHLAPLRDRAADILPLAEHFLAQSGSGKRLSTEAAARLIQHRWPGNVRELKNAIDRASVLVRGHMIDAVDLAFLGDLASPAAHELDWPDEDLPAALARLELFLIRRALERSAGNRAEAARLLNINRQLLYAKIKRHGLDLSGDATEDVTEADNDTQA